MKPIDLVAGPRDRSMRTAGARTLMDVRIERWNGMSHARRVEEREICLREGHDWKPVSDGWRMCWRCCEMRSPEA
jgi:hypothetical protein